MAKLPKFRMDDPCQSCPMGEEGCTRLATKGTRQAKILVVISLPHDHNAAYYKEYFSEKAMNVFKRAMVQNGFSNSEFVFHSAIKCHFKKDERPTGEKTQISEHCREFLLRAIDKMKPEIIIPLGVDATKAVYGRAKKITKVRGICEWDKELNAHIFPMIDPIMVAMYPQNWGVFQADARSLSRLIDNGYNQELVQQEGLGEYEEVEDLQFLIEQEPDEIVFDTETEGLRWAYEDKRLLTMQFCVSPGRAYLVSWDHPDNPAGARKKARIRRQVRELLCRPNVIIAGHNLKYDTLWLWAKLQIRIRIGDDTLMLAAIHDENNMNKDLSTLTKMYVQEMAGYDDLFNATYDKAHMEDVPLAKIVEYGCGDVDATCRLLYYFRGQINHDNGLIEHYENVSLPGLNAFASIEPRGLIVHEDRLHDLQGEVFDHVEALRISLIQQIPRAIKREHIENKKEIKLSRADLLRDVLFEHPAGFSLRPRIFTKTTKNLKPEFRIPSTSSKDHLPFFFEDCPFTEELAEWMKVNRLLGTNIEKFEENYMIGNMVYPSYQLHVAVTGRTSCLRDDQLVDTRRGKKRADQIQVGDELLTHKQRWMPVTKLFRKPVTPMFKVTFTNGETLTCTADHIVLTNEGEWVTLRSLVRECYGKCKQDTDERQDVGAQGSEHVQKYHDDCSAGSRRMRSASHNSESYDRGVCVERRVQEIRALQISREQAGRKEPTVWEQAGVRLAGQGWVPNNTDRRSSSQTAYHGDGGVDRREDTERLDSASHRRRQGKLQEGQPSADDNGGTQHDTQKIQGFLGGHGIASIDSAGSHRVYDFEVDEDHSYLAAGVFSHNSQDPNGQNFPKRGRFAKSYRDIFIPPPGYVMLEADLSQAELRIAADMANDQVMIRIYNEIGGDIHKTTALIVSGLTMAQFLELAKSEQSMLRFKAKAVNFGFIYGMGWRNFIIYAKTQYGVEFTAREAERIRDEFFARYPRLIAWHRGMRDFAKEHGFVRSYSGRVRHLPMIYSSEDYIRHEAERQAINSPVQEFASTLGVMALSDIDQNIDPEYLTITGFVHDAIYALAPLEYAEWAAKTMKHYMETVDIQEKFGRVLSVPMIADVSIGISGGAQYEMENLRVNRPYNWNDLDLPEDMDEIPFDLPEQLIPPDNGRIELPEYLKAA